jgi:ATP phosphoribosyltransferase
MDKDSRLKLAVQKSGRLTDHSLDLLSRCGLKLSRGKDQLMGFGENLPLDVLFVRDDDIPDLVQEDVCDLGLVGLNVLEERRLEMAARGATARFEILRRLDFGHCRLSLAVPEGMAWKDLSSIAGLRIATTYPAMLADSCSATASRPRSSRSLVQWRSRRAWAVPT